MGRTLDKCIIYVMIFLSRIKLWPIEDVRRDIIYIIEERRDDGNFDEIELYKELLRKISYAQD